MELWNDFEGKVVDDRFRLGRLLAPKGRSAFFAATTLAGEPITMRLIESLNDEDEILSRWGVVEGIQEEHLQRMAASGRTVLDGTHLVYAVLEPAEMSLDEVLRDRVLTADETRQMAAAVVGGLEALHRGGLVHEHVEAASVLARGETVKLRSDCVREAPEGAEGEALRRRDAHDLAMLVGYALTGRRDGGQGMLPRQFEDLVRNGMNGTWGMKEMSALLRPAVAKAAAVPQAQTAGGKAGAGVAAGAGPVLVAPRETGAAVAGAAAPAGVVSEAVSRAGAVPARPVGGAPGGAERKVAGVAASSPVALPPGGSGGVPEVAGRPRATAPAAVASALVEEDATVPARGIEGRRTVLEPEEAPHRFALGPWIAAGVVALVLILLIVHFAHGGSGSKAVVAPAPLPAATVPQAVLPPKPSAAGAVPGGSTSSARASAAPIAATGSGAWRVIAYTYSHRDQAEHKAETISARHPELRAEAFSPHGRGPYLVALGGWMSEREAIAFRARALREGMPRDTFARNYHGH